MNTVLSSEYECRRRMLIKRLDVTVQSFGWSDRAKARLYKGPLLSVYLTLDTSGKEPKTASSSGDFKGCCSLVS